MMETLYRSSEIRIPENVEESRTISFRISDATRDRHGTVLNMDGWNLDNYNRNGIVGYQHDVYGGGMCEGPNPDSVIGKGRAWLNHSGTRDSGEPESVLMGEVEFEPKEINPLAEKVFQKVRHGTLSATSVGFRAVGGGTLVNHETGKEKEMERAPWSISDNETFYFKGQELLEFSVVNIPSNPNALKKSVRDFSSNALRFVKSKLDMSYGAIEQLRVIDVLRLLENPEQRELLFEAEKEIEEETRQEPINGLRLLQRKLEHKKATHKYEVNQ